MVFVPSHLDSVADNVDTTQTKSAISSVVNDVNETVFSTLQCIAPTQHLVDHGHGSYL
jgi:hypothetical protein